MVKGALVANLLDLWSLFQYVCVHRGPGRAGSEEVGAARGAATSKIIRARCARAWGKERARLMVCNCSRISGLKTMGGRFERNTHLERGLINSSTHAPKTLKNGFELSKMS